MISIINIIKTLIIQLQTVKYIESNCALYAFQNQCILNKPYMDSKCYEDCRLISLSTDLINTDMCHILELHNFCFTDSKLMILLCPKTCSNTNLNSNCVKWASQGECDKNPDYMLINCKKICNNKS
jgi:hypothetical protein